jgi:hypothetical protein
MQTLIIKDLAVAADLDRAAMASVRGGTGYCAPSIPAYCPPKPVFCEPAYYGPSLDLNASSMTFNASQMLGQAQNTTVNNGNNVAFASGITANVNPSQHGSNNINFG